MMLFSLLARIMNYYLHRQIILYHDQTRTILETVEMFKENIIINDASYEIHEEKIFGHNDLLS